MPTFEVTDPESGRKVRLTGESAPTEQELEKIFAEIPEKGSPLGGVASEIGETAFNATGEVSAGFNRFFVDGVDFALNALNVFPQALGLEQRIPLVRDLTDRLGATQGGFVENDLARDILATAGETAGAAFGFQNAISAAARNLPKIQPATESVKAGALRAANNATSSQATTAGALSGAGAEVGEEVGGDKGRLVGSVVAPITPTAIKEGAKSVVKQAATGGRQKEIQAVVENFAESGSVPNLGQAVDSEAVQGAQTISSKFLGGAPLRRQLDDTRQKIQQRLIAIADDVSSVKGEEAAGRVIQKGIKSKGGFVDRFQDKSGVLWGRVDEAIGDDAVVPLQNTRQAFDSLNNKGVFGEVLNNPLVTRLGQIAAEAGDQAAYSELKTLRSQIGRKLGSNELVSDIPRAELKQLYGAITQDIKAIAFEKGAAKEFTRANKFTSAGHARIDDFVERIANKVDLDKVFNVVVKGGEGSQVINSFKRSLKPEEWEAVASNVIRRLGKPTDSQNVVGGEGFSINSFVTQWNKLGPAKKALFSGSNKLNEYQANLDRIAKSAQRFKDDTVAQANPSGSGVFAANVGAGGGAVVAAASGNFGAAASLLALVAANNRAAALMANPRFVKWLAQSTTLRDSQIPAHIARLPAVAEASNSTDVLGFLQVIEDTQAESQGR